MTPLFFFQIHVESNKSYKCKHCALEFRHHSSLVRHLCRHAADVSDSDRVHCRSCDATFEDAFELKAHAKEAHAEVATVKTEKTKKVKANRLIAPLTPVASPKPNIAPTFTFPAAAAAAAATASAAAPGVISQQQIIFAAPNQPLMDMSGMFAMRNIIFDATGRQQQQPQQQQPFQQQPLAFAAPQMFAQESSVFIFDPATQTFHASRIPSINLFPPQVQIHPPGEITPVSVAATPTPAKIEPAVIPKENLMEIAMQEITGADGGGVVNTAAVIEEVASDSDVTVLATSSGRKPVEIVISSDTDTDDDARKRCRGAAAASVKAESSSDESSGTGGKKHEFACEKCGRSYKYIEFLRVHQKRCK